LYKPISIIKSKSKEVKHVKQYAPSADEPLVNRAQNQLGPVTTL